MDKKYTAADEHVAGVSEDGLAYRMYHTCEAIHTRFDEFEQTMDEGKVQWRSESDVDSWINGLA